MTNKLDFSSARVGDILWSELYQTSVEVISKASNKIVLLSANLRFERSITGKTNTGMQDLYWSKPEISGGDIPPKRLKKVKVWVGVVWNVDVKRISLTDGYETEESLIKHTNGQAENVQQIELEIEE